MRLGYCVMMRGVNSVRELMFRGVFMHDETLAWCR